MRGGREVVHRERVCVFVHIESRDVNSVSEKANFFFLCHGWLEWRAALYKGFNVNFFFSFVKTCSSCPLPDCVGVCWILFPCLVGMVQGYLETDVAFTLQAYVSYLMFCRRSHVPCYRDTFQMYMSKLQVPFSHTATDSDSSTHKYPPKEPRQAVKKGYHPLEHLRIPTTPQHNKFQPP